jgi:hypothetical protein
MVQHESRASPILMPIMLAISAGAGTLVTLLP